ncbi:MAG: DEAD/DEAH box helicase [Saprospiraceae bacterium]|nr:DEAD/DEAH box helicase [Saprospiraceae bacterium]
MESDQLLRTTLSNLDIPVLNEMQEQAFHTIPDEKDTILLAPTGSGKTLAFLLPILHLLKTDQPGVQCLVLSPTRELAIQIERVWQKMSTGFKVNTCYGGHPMQTEINNLSQPPALLIGTPGRIVEHINRKTFDPQTVRIIVLDEFDKSLAMGFQEQMAEILKALGGLEKRILASATTKLVIPPFVGITKPITLNYTDAEAKSTDGLSIKSVVSAAHDKFEALVQLLCYFGSEPTLIFCNQRETTEITRERLAERGIASASFHGGMEQVERESTLVQFRNGSIVFLVASDLAARGLDIPEVKNVVHYELPMKLNDFIHRNGRTARMHAQGVAYLILPPDELLPAYLTERPEVLQLPDDHPLPPFPSWVTLYISGGKKDKLSKIDIVGFLSKKGGLKLDDLGKIEMMDHMSFIAVKKDVLKHLLKAIANEKMKGKKYKIAVAK